MGCSGIIAFAVLASMYGWQPSPVAAAPIVAAAQASAVTPSELFDIADAARDRGAFALAETAYRALAGNPDIELRTEARFRLGLMLADQMGKRREAAVEFRHILDEKPDAVRVRLELARMQALLGNMAAAGREVRAAQAAGLPPEVDRLVRFFANALDARKPIGGSFEVAIAPDTNINRATRADTLDTLIGDFTLDRNARARSGIGLSLRGQGYARAPLGDTVDLLVRLSGDADLYREKRFDDIAFSVQAGPQFRVGADRVSLAASLAWRWYGLQPYSISYGANGTWQHALGKRAQLRLEGAAVHERNRFNALRNADRFTAGAAVERSITARFGGGLQLSALREVARDPGHSLAAGGFTAYAFRELGRTTAVATAGYTHLEADQRTLLLPRRRIDDRFSAALSATFRALRLGTLAPLARIRFERNRSTVGFYDFQRIAAEFGVTAAF